MFTVHKKSLILKQNWVKAKKNEKVTIKIALHESVQLV